MTDKQEREAFEKWADSFYREGEVFPKLKRHGDGYHHASVHSSWQAWNARASLQPQGVDEAAVNSALLDYFRDSPYPESSTAGAMEAIRPHLHPQQAQPASDELVEHIKWMAIAHDMTHGDTTDVSHWKDEFERHFRAAISTLPTHPEAMGSKPHLVIFHLNNILFECRNAAEIPDVLKSIESEAKACLQAMITGKADAKANCIYGNEDCPICPTTGKGDL